MGNIKEKYMDSSRTASDRMRDARADAEARALAYDLDLDGTHTEARLAALQSRRDRKQDAAERSKDRKDWRNTILTGGAIGVAAVVAVVGMNKLTVAEVGQVPKPNPNQISELSPINTVVTRDIPRSQMTAAQQAQHDYLESGQLPTDQK